MRLEVKPRFVACWISNMSEFVIPALIIDREAREIMYLVASVRLSVHLSVRQRSHG